MVVKMIRPMFRRLVIGLLLATVIFCLSGSFVNGAPGPDSASDLLDEQDRALRIVGGSQANPGDYPYFVQTRNGGCGGVLIASEWVLTAVHCGDIKGQKVLIGAYKIRSTEYGAQERTCTEFYRDPNFYWTGGDLDDPYAPFKYDAALCKLDTPVYIDDSRVRFELNQNINYPPVGTSVVAVGFGTTSAGGPQPEKLRHVTVKVDSNARCQSAPSSLYQQAGSQMICASVPGGGKDACQGDSGGPLVVKTRRNGKDVHVHVGLTSWGIGCASERYPGVYARTSHSMNFIRRTICTNGNSPSPFCRTTSLNCNSSTQQKLDVKLVPDFFPGDISWSVTRNNQVVLSGANYNPQKKYMTYEKSICLEKGSTYQFVINDSYGDGLTTSVNPPGVYTLSLDGIEFARGFDYDSVDRVNIQTAASTITRPPSRRPTKPPTRRPTLPPTLPPTNVQIAKQPRGKCKDLAGYRFNGKSCAELFSDGKKKKKKCNQKDPNHDGKRVKKFCRSYCRQGCPNKGQSF